MPPGPALLELNEILSQEARQIIAARERALVLHRTKDIDAAGDEVEMLVRKVLRDRVPELYHVGHGHIVDAKWRCSRQFDLILADHLGAAALFRAHNTTSYYPYEAVYAFGEIKSAYYASKGYIGYFSDSLREIRASLERQETPPNYLNHGLTLGAGISASLAGGWRYRNPLFSFMFFATANDFSLKQVAELYRSRPVTELPNVVVFLDGGVLVNARISTVRNPGEPWKFISVNFVPEFSVPGEGERDAWVLLHVGSKESREASNLAFLYMAIVGHLQRSQLVLPDIGAYFSSLLTLDGGVLLEATVSS